MSGSAQGDEEAILAVKQMQFKPAMKDNEPVVF
jgi:hypothetical protein